MVRMRGDPRTRAYVERRTAQGMSNKEIHRCLKRYIIRALYPLIVADLADSARVARHRHVSFTGPPVFSVARLFLRAL
jgi:hypothetical protein